ncbi:MAG: molybdate ABC transporter permease subunit [Dehalococcoidia bacterium]|nr:molybdate ABC transporter permease subunit [Dehalococcoidia bacterium]
MITPFSRMKAFAAEPTVGKSTVYPQLRRVRNSGRPNLARGVLIAIVLIYVTALIVVPVMALFPKAFSNGIGASWDAITSINALLALRLTFILAVAAVVVNTIFGIVLAMVMVRQNFWGKRFVNGIIDLPFVVSPVIVGFMFLVLFGRGGWLAPTADFIGIKVAFSWPGMMLATIFVSLPFVCRELMPVLKEMGIEHEQAAYTLGATRWQTFWRVTLPGVRRALLYGITLTFARAMGEFGAILIVGGAIAGKTETSTLFIFRSLDNRQYVAAYSTALILALISFVVLASLELVKRKQRE